MKPYQRCFSLFTICNTILIYWHDLSFQEYKSTETRIVLRNVDLSTSGKFRCEVSGEAPLFQTATSTNVLIVVGKKTNQNIGLVTAIKHLTLLFTHLGWSRKADFFIGDHIWTQLEGICKQNAVAYGCFFSAPLDQS